MIKIHKVGNLSISRKGPNVNVHPLACTQLFTKTKKIGKNYSLASLDAVNKGLSSKVVS